MSERKLQFVEGKSSKFWHAKVDGTNLIVNFGRIGTSGQTQEKSFASATEATKAFDKLVAEKVKKGYVDDADGGSVSAPVAQPKAPKPEAPRTLAEKSEPPGDETAASGSAEPSRQTEDAGESTATEDPVPETAPAASVVRDPGAPYVRPPVRIRVSDADRARGLVGGVIAPQPMRARWPFDREQCLLRLAQVGKSGDHAYQLRWDRAAYSVAMSREEAWVLWTLLRTHGRIDGAIHTFKEGTPQEPKADFAGFYTHAAITGTLVYAAFGADALVDFLVTANGGAPAVRATIESDVVPYLDEETRTAMRERLHVIASKSTYTAWVVRLLGHLGEPVDSLRKYISAWGAGSGKSAVMGANYGYGGNDVLGAIFALCDPDEVAREAERLAANPPTGAEARALIAATGVRRLDLVAASALAANSKADAEPIVRALALVEAPECAPFMLQVMLESKAPAAAREWLDQHPEFASEALIALVGSPGAKGEAATTYLRGLHRRGLDAVLEAALATLPAATAKSAREKIFADAGEELDVARDDELPEWAARCFGDPTKLTAPDVQLTPEELDPTPRVELSESDRAKVLTPELPPVQALPPAPPFDFEASLAKLLAAATSYKYGSHPAAGSWYVWNLAGLNLSLPMSREEAHFWIVAFVQCTHTRSASDVEAVMRSKTFDGRGGESGVNNLLLLVPYFVLNGFAGIVRALDITYGPASVEFTQRVINSIVRYLGEDDRKALRAHLLASHSPSTPTLLLARRLGASRDELRPAIQRMGSSQHAWMNPALDLLYVLQDPNEIVAEATRLNFSPWDGKTAREWIAATGPLGAKRLGDALAHTYGDKQGMAKALAMVAAPEVAVAMLPLRKSSAVKETVRQWFESHPLFVIDGLLPLVGTKDKLASAAVDVLREMRRRGYAKLIESRSKGDATVQKLVLDPRAGLAKPAEADRALAPLLPQIRIETANGPRRLAPAHVEIVLAELRASTLGAPTPRLALVREHADPHALDAFAWAVFQGWLNDGAPSKEKWKLETLGHLGSDASALKLAPLVRTWPGESQHQRAVAGLDCLRAIGTDTALMQIHGIAQKVSFKGIKERANECLDGIALDRGLSRDELADRIIPDGGLDDRGSRVFDFGPRQFTFVLGSDLKPMVRDAAGKRLPDLPKPGAKDDATSAQRAVAEWKVLKKQVADVAKTQATRLELAMVVGRRWTPEEFESLFVKHPLMVLLVRRLIWGAYDAEKKSLGTFRVGDDNTYSNSKDEPFEFPAGTTHVGVVHPSHLDEAERAAWGEVVSDYEIIPPFVQLGRATYALTDAERTASLVKRFDTHDVDAKVLVFGLEGLGWTRGRPQDGGGFCAHHKQFGDVTAVVTYRDGCWVGTNGDDWSRQKIEALGFIRDGKAAEDGFFSWAYGGPDAMPLDEIDPVVMSEALHDVTRLFERGKPA